MRVLSPVAPRFLPPSLAILAVLFVAVGLVSVWPEPWDDDSELTRGRAPVTAPRISFSAALGGVEAMEQPLTVTPLFENGVPRGLSLGAVHDGSLFAHMGLQEGDLLLSFHDLGAKDAPHLVAHVERDGRPLRVEYSLPARGTSPRLPSSSLSARAADAR